MLITNTVNKKILETIIHESFLNFGNIASSSLLDSLKLLGFYYATNSGISINIEDLKTPFSKQEILMDVSNEIFEVSSQWEQGFISDIERFQTIIDSWNSATESLKNKIIDYYKTFDPLNNLYVMAFSGARGNMSQVRQLVGMRGLMSDQEGNIIDLPIQANFREGLSSIDYIISSYGARKGVVDTALKTADAGYLTRRLIYLAQDLIIREIDCKTKNGVLFFLNKKTNTKNIVGRMLIFAKEFKNEKTIGKSNSILTETLLHQLKAVSPISIKVRSPLNCQSNGSICQYCYGWDLAQHQLISLGEAVGIIAAQSIGEPGTQLTMRTFHTGGIFTSELLQQTIASFSGKLMIPISLKGISIRNNHGVSALKLQQELTLKLYNWKGISEDVFLPIGSFLYVKESCFVKKGQLIAEYSTKSAISGKRRLKPIYAQMDAEIKFESLLVRSIARGKYSKVKINEDDGILWLTSGKIFPLPKETLFSFSNAFKNEKALGKIKIVSPINGIITNSGEKICISNETQKIELNFSQILKKIKNCRLKIVPIIKNYQYIDPYTVLGFVYLFPLRSEKVYLIRKKECKFTTTFFFITESDIWKMNIDQPTNFLQTKTIVKAGTSITPTAILSKSGFLLKKDGLKLIFQKAIPIFLTRGTILNYKKGDFVNKNQTLGTLVNYRQQTEDIVQGLPKIEEIIEARSPKLKAALSKRPGVFITNFNTKSYSKYLFESSSFNFNYKLKASILEDKKKTKKEEKTQIIQVIHSLFSNGQYFVEEEKIWEMISFPPALLTSRSDKDLSKAKKEKLQSQKESLMLEKYINHERVFYQKIDSKTSLSNKGIPKKLLEIKGEKILLRLLNPLRDYDFPINRKLNLKTGEFVDLGEPISDGMIDPHELLEIFFEYHLVLDGLLNGTIRSLNKFQLILINSILAIYSSQGVNISSKHIEIIVRQMTSKAQITENGDTPLLAGESIRISLLLEILKSISATNKENRLRFPKFLPVFMSSTNSSLLGKDGFLSAAGFQETKRVLTKAAIEGTSDWLRGLKECIIVGRLIPAGSSFLNYKNYLDNIYYFKETNKKSI